ncbi:uncharacterized protein LOC111396780 isoform X2 [Olea europaea var. sylvestris]|uniref:uncharacterized protein LOC111396780 isoform X2 n=1 Tax=Olea europaea var. sylvestris TaxID=158386 RepID=UPI000C1D684A|nr:uncharacterized protein LOC111396780 isoform X2 [Olea europaea var. sylvestris]
MRIRKHAKICSLTYAASSLKPGTVLQTHVCQLNQSPWDVMSFSPPSTPPPPLPPPSFQVNENDDFARNGSFGESIATFDSSMSMKMALDDGEIEAMKLEYSDSVIVGGSVIGNAEEGVPKKDREIIFCCKTDGKGWKCKREAAEGNSLCKHHLSLVRNYNNWAPPAAKKVDKVAADSHRCPRARKVGLTSNPHEFYYYSGFGPRWGKKRGEKNQISNSRDASKNIDQRHEMAQSSMSQIDIEESDIEDEIEYEEEEEEENSESESRRKRKRARKPIKARSLKSLM